ncbi:ExbD/TolR family protein [Denitromonas iodatirespirans]|uniref:Biopolymer transporter ExbD n=1 Tax=Denitromonas iodatirespirans TaxID=2795389 RepID=A0A944D7N9_DENI1|nr:biopolymer transporter ExbD [Denitromonas iodatirespirans]MBT0959826.1 biopolymer transporter ExbD [Denitromonas iodatirespirans]
MAFGGFDNSGQNAPMSEINTTPLVDVMLVLLIIFMITAPLLTHSVKIDLPTASSAPTVETPDTITVSLNAEGQLFWNNDPIDKATLDLRLADAATQQPQPELHLRADQETRYAAIAELMAAARQAGVQKLGFVTLPADE